MQRHKELHEHSETKNSAKQIKKIETLHISKQNVNIVYIGQQASFCKHYRDKINRFLL
jgi:hypothetical protein